MREFEFEIMVGDPLFAWEPALETSRSFNQSQCTVCREYCEIGSEGSVWKHISFFNIWPTTDSLHQRFVSAAEHGNFEALTKLAFSRLYNDRLPQSERHVTLEEQAKQAAHYFCEAEKLSGATFTWAFLRPPWAPNTPSCKVFVFDTLLNYAAEKKLKKSHSQSKIALCIGHTMLLREKEKEAAGYIHQAAQLGLHEAKVFEWDRQYSQEVSAKFFKHYGRELEAVRQLRGLVHEKAEVLTELRLCKCYTKGMLGGYQWSQATTFTRKVFQSSRPISTCPVFTPNVKGSKRFTAWRIRYILVDWLAEVANNLKMPTLMLLNAVAIVDRCQRAHTFLKAQIQLLGVSALLITSRFMASDILTIREAVWYTDNTYTYENVVEMMGHIVSILKGDIRQVTSRDFREVLESLFALGREGSYVLDYLAELCMLHDYMVPYSPATTAAATILMARILGKAREVWPAQLEDVTGFTVTDLTPCVLNINNCLLEEVPCDNSQVPLEAVKQRFNYIGDVSYLKGLNTQELKKKLGVSSLEEQTTSCRHKLHQAESLIRSPSRGKQGSRRLSMVERPSREDAATPPVDLDASGYEGDDDEDFDPFGLNDSFRSEDAEEEPKTDSSFLEMSSELDGMVGEVKPPHFISDCSQAALSSPFRIKINISNMSLSTSTSTSANTSGLGSSSNSSSICQYAPASGSGFSEDGPHQGFHHDSDDDHHFGGFSCMEEVSSQDEDDDVKGARAFDGGALLPYPIGESSAQEGQRRGRLHDPVELDYAAAQEGYGILNEAFCEHDLEEAAGTSKAGTFSHSQYVNWADTAAAANLLQKHHSPSSAWGVKRQQGGGGFMLDERLDRQRGRKFSRPQTRGLVASCGLGAMNKASGGCVDPCDQGLVASCGLGAMNKPSGECVDPCDQGLVASCGLGAMNKPSGECVDPCDQGRSVKHSLCLPFSCVALPSSSWASRTQQREAGAGNTFAFLSRGCESSTASSTSARRRVSTSTTTTTTTTTHDEESQSLLLSVPSPSPLQSHHPSVPYTDSAAARRKSLRSNARTSQRESSPSHCPSADRTGESTVGCGADSGYVSFCHSSPSQASPLGDQREGRCQDSPAVTKRKSPRLPAQLASPDSKQPKRQRRCSANYGN
ncbi:hypothetical protein ACOMHN_005316 [Nucella lapillus]